MLIYDVVWGTDNTVRLINSHLYCEDTQTYPKSLFLINQNCKPLFYCLDVNLLTINPILYDMYTNSLYK